MIIHIRRATRRSALMTSHLSSWCHFLHLRSTVSDISLPLSPPGCWMCSVRHCMLCSCAFSSPTNLVPSPILEGLGTRLQPHPLCMTVCVIVHVAAPPTMHDCVCGAHSGSLQLCMLQLWTKLGNLIVVGFNIPNSHLLYNLFTYRSSIQFIPANNQFQDRAI